MLKRENSCKQVLRDPDEHVRWSGVLSSQRCGVPLSHLPLELSQRVRTGKSVIGATILNFFFLGVGYDYLGKWWGLLVLEIYMLLFFRRPAPFWNYGDDHHHGSLHDLVCSPDVRYGKEGGNPERVIVWWTFQTSWDKKSRISRS